MNTQPRRWTVVAASVVMFASLLVGIPQAASASDAAPAKVSSAGLKAIDGSQFDAGYIISDKIFFDKNAMSEAQVQAWLEARLPTCAQTNGVPCMKNFTETTTSREASPAGNCAAYAGAANERASTIIWKVAQACGINPQVILVTLQKEQGLITKGSPTTLEYRKAMGYGCPDTSSCDSKYYGFFNQVYSAAWQFRQYTLFPNRAYKIGNVAIRYAPAAGCEGPAVYIRNQATANLYNYTPYQPNAATLATLTGPNSAPCSSYGNRNFWVYFSNWFGSPTGLINPFGAVDVIAADVGGVRIQGWTLDPDSSDSLDLHVYIDGVGTVVKADQPRADVAALYPSAGELHGFSTVIPVASGGSHMVCINAINVGPGSNVQLGDCRVVTTRSGPPTAVLDSVMTAQDSITVSGWSFDPDTAASLTMRVTVDGVATDFLADSPRDDVAAAYPGYGPNHGYTKTVTATPGAHTVCVTAVNVGQGSDTALACRTATVPSPPGSLPDLGRAPFGALEPPVISATGVTASGWAIDPDTASAIRVHLYVGPAAVNALANKPRADVGAVYPDYGPDHAFSETIALSPGTYQLCAYAINSGSTGPPNTQIGCRTVAVPYPPGTIPDLGRAPFGVIDTVVAGDGNVSISGWAIDLDTAAAIRVHVYVDANGVNAAADKPRSDVAAAYPGYGENHAYSETITASPGSHRVCAYAINNGAGPGNTLLGCRTVTVPYPPGQMPDLGRAPFGVVDTVTTSPGRIDISGWAIDLDTSAAIRVHIYVGSIGVNAAADKPRADVAAAYPGYGANHAYSETIAIAPGRYQICAYAINSGSGPGNTLLSCRQVVVP